MNPVKKVKVRFRANLVSGTRPTIKISRKAMGIDIEYKSDSITTDEIKALIWNVMVNEGRKPLGPFTDIEIIDLKEVK